MANLGVFFGDTFVRILFYVGIIVLLDLEFGFTDIPNFGVTGFVAIGAYTTAILTAVDPTYGIGLGMPWWVGWIGGALLTALVGLLISFVTLRVSELYLALVTFAFAEITLRLIENIQPITGGSSGLLNLDQVVPASASPEVHTFVGLVTILLLVGAISFGWYRVATSPFGRVLQGIRVDELVVSVSGKNTLWYKVKIFTFGSALMGLLGSFWASYNGGVVPNMFFLQVLVLIWIGMIIGGNRSLIGLFVGGFIIFALRISTRFVSVPGMTDTQFSSFRLMLIGLVLALIIIKRPEGIFGRAEEIMNLD